MDLFGFDYVVPAAIAGFLLLMVLFVWLRARSKDSGFKLQRKSRLLPPAERNFFESLMPALSNDFYVFTRVSMTDVVAPLPSASFFEKRRLRKRLHGEYLDYVLCNKEDLSIFGIVELENFDSSVTKKQRGKREALVNTVCKAANLRLFYFDIRQDYKNVDIGRLVTGRSSKPSKPKYDLAERSQFTIEDSSYAAYTKHRNCPQCNGEVVSKVAIKGKHIGKKYLMCRKYPYCDYRVALNDEQVVKQVRAQESEDESVIRPGFKDWSAG